ncbi:23S rRNA (adenine(1618)-N(6))-methyltransferase RlmF [Daejeonella oryzae]|uniref:23S rRNA (adenine(1618)-N(6))-methyltransferase RlmF n=1 Tax=Daejeonella oryzae TaxID=1122943 RepID=UPI00040DC950|nr:23S rRNA (adenine(1618)-N(6))-methyltransferase RlmF [Daejeonella oryzae]
MSPSAEAKPPEKLSLHPRNKHRLRYDFKSLSKANPGLKTFVGTNKYGDESIDFSNPEAVKSLNKALLIFFYEINYWDIPEGFLCPPIPGRADYIHYAADLLATLNNGIIPRKPVRVLDVGVGANCIYPLIGNKEYDWNFVGSDVSQSAVDSAQKIVSDNQLENAIEIRKQQSPANFFKGIIKPGELFDLSICNPPFHSSLAEATSGTKRKLKNLGIASKNKPILNFGGQGTELFCEGGEERFLGEMILESRHYSKNVCWFTSLVSKSKSLESSYNWLRKVKAAEYKTIDMAQGQKISRVLTWTFLSKKEQESWSKNRWQIS